jgi:hypothetical protein
MRRSRVSKVDRADRTKIDNRPRRESQPRLRRGFLFVRPMHRKVDAAPKEPRSVISVERTRRERGSLRPESSPSFRF